MEKSVKEPTPIVVPDPIRNGFKQEPLLREDLVAQQRVRSGNRRLRRAYASERRRGKAPAAALRATRRRG